MGMIVVNTDFVPCKEIVKVLGIVKGNVIQAKHVGKDIAAGFRHTVGGEIKEYTEMMSEAEEMGADAVVNLRFMNLTQLLM